MSENEIKRDLSRYDALTTEELEQILLADLLITDEDEEYLEMIVYVAEGYAQRKQAEELASPQATQSKKVSFIQRYIRPIAATAAVIAVLIGGTITARSMGFDPWEAVAKWTSDVFAVNAPDATFSDEDLLETIERMKPKWLPDGFELVEEGLSKNEPITYHASYQKDNCEINLVFRENISGNISYSEKNDTSIEIFETNKHTFYLFQNHNRVIVVWFADGLRCRISGEISTDEMKKIISAIETQ